MFFFFFNDTATTEIYTLSLHDALPIWFTSGSRAVISTSTWSPFPKATQCSTSPRQWKTRRSEEHTSELQSQSNLVCRLLLEKKKKSKIPYHLHPRTTRRSLRSRAPPLG